MVFSHVLVSIELLVPIVPFKVEICSSSLLHKEGTLTIYFGLKHNDKYLQWAQDLTYQPCVPLYGSAEIFSYNGQQLDTSGS